MNTKSLAFAVAVALSGITIKGAVTPAQAVTLSTFNGNFTGATVNGTPVTTSVYLGDTNVSLPGWYFPQNLQYGTDPGFNFLVKYGSQVYDGGLTGNVPYTGNLADQNRSAPPFSFGGGTAGLVGSGSVLDPLNNGTSGFFIAADGFFKHGALNTDFTGLTPGNTYTVSFYQAAGQQVRTNTGNSNFTENFAVTFGGTTQQSATMNYTAGSSVTPWQKQSLSFIATSANQTLSFLSQSPNDVPPFALLADVSVVDASSTKVPEPSNYLGTIVCAGFLAVAVRRAAKNKFNK